MKRSVKTKHRKDTQFEGFSKLREKIINRAERRGISLEELFSYDPPVSKTGRFPPILKDHSR